MAKIMLFQEHLQTCNETVCLKSILFFNKLTQITGTLNNYEELLKYCSDFLICLKKKALNQVNPSCLENLCIFFVHEIKCYAEKTQLCQKFIQMIALVHRINAEMTAKSLEIFFNDTRKVFDHKDEKSHDLYMMPLLRAFSMVLESIKKFGDVIENDKMLLFASIVSMFSDNLLGGTTVFEKQTVYYIMKVILQLLQHNGREASIEPSSEIYSKCFSISMSILRSEDCIKDSQLVAASVVVELLKLIRDDDNLLPMTFLCFHYLLGDLSLNGSSTFAMGSIVFCGALLAHSDVKKLTASLANLESVSSKMEFEFKAFGRNSSNAKIFDYQKHFSISIAGGLLDLDSVRNKELYSFIFEVAMLSCKSSSHLHYQALKLLQQWCQMLPSFRSSSQVNNLLVEHLRQELMSLIMIHVESQIDGVDRNAVDLFASLLDSFREISSCDSNFNESFKSFKMDFYAQIVLFSWNIKSKYLLLGPILEHFPDVLEVKRLMLDLRKCLSTNHLVPCSTAVYKKIILNFEQTSRLNLWNKHCCPHLIDALTNSKSLERKNAAHYWLPVTLQIVPESVNSMLMTLDHLENLCSSTCNKGLLVSGQTLNDEVQRSSIVYARLRILCAAKMAALSHFCPLKDMEFAFSSSSNDLRLAALCLICISPSTTDCPTENDVSLLKHHLSQQMSVSDPAFRKEMEKCLRSICTRCRDHGLMQLRVQKRKKNEAFTIDETSINISIDLIDFVWHTCANNLSPNSNFQRSYSALTWMKIVLGTFVSTPRQHIRKGIIPADVDLFIESAKERKRCDFFNESCTIALLSCIFNEVEEISEMSSEILQLFFPWPLKCESLMNSRCHLDEWRSNQNECIVPQNDFAETYSDMDIWLLRESLILCNNFRSRESTCGVVLGGLVFSRCVLDAKSSFYLEKRGNDILVSKMSLPQQDSMSSGISFLEQLLTSIIDNFHAVDSNIVDRSSTLPLHGMISLLITCLKKLPSVEEDDELNAGRMKQFTKRVVNFCQSLICSVLNIFGGRFIGEATSPSFEQISCAIMELIEDSRTSRVFGAHGKVSEAEIAKLHQIITSWCWLNIKESVLLLGEVVRYFVFIDAEDLIVIGQIFFKVLTQCRHRGAIESCTSGFLNFCLAAFHSSNKFFFDLPAALVAKVFDQLEALSDSSTTRRSAGLPSIIQTVLISEARCGQVTILKQVVARLLEISSGCAAQREFQEQRDHPQVHGMNILKTLVHESHLSDAMSQYLEPIILTVLDAFNSDNWMIRNAALQLFGSMVPRMLGEKMSSDETTHSTNSSEFLSRFPKLFHSIIEILGRETQQMKNSSTYFVDFCERFVNVDTSNDLRECKEGTFSHSLMPILSLLSRLAPGYHLEKQKSREELVLCCLVQNLCQSSMLAVRKLSAKVLLVLVHKEHLYELLVAMVTLLPSRTNNYFSANHVHGLLLQMLELHAPAADCLSEEQLSSVRALLDEKTCLLFSSCLLMRTCFLKIIEVWHPQWNLFTDDVEKNLMKYQFRNNEVGSALYQQTLVNIWLSQLCHHSLLANHIGFCLSSDSVDIVQAALEWLLNFHGHIPNGSKIKVVNLLWNLLEDSSRLMWPILCSTLKVLLMSDKHSDTKHSFDEKWNLLKDICDVAICAGDDNDPSPIEDRGVTTRTYTPSTLALELLSKILSEALMLKSIAKEGAREKILLWSQMILWCSMCSKNVELRSSSVRACRDVVHVCFRIFIENHSQHLDGDWMIIFSRLLKAGLKSLTDDDPNIRIVAAEMISSVRTIKFPDDLLPPSIHHEIATKMWLETLLDITDRNHSIVRILFDIIEENKMFQNLGTLCKNSFELDDVFQVEDDNPYFEADQLHRTISLCLLEIPALHCPLDFIKNKISSFESKIASMMNLMSSMKSRSLLEFASDRKLHACLSSMHWQHVLLKTFIDDVTADEDLDQTKISLASHEKEIDFLVGEGCFRGRLSAVKGSNNRMI